MHGEKVSSISGQTDSVACGWCCEFAVCHGQIDLLKRHQLQHNLYVHVCYICMYDTKSASLKLAICIFKISSCISGCILGVQV